ncbi:OmpA family protein [Campylobacterota bacterium DY0563]
MKKIILSTALCASMMFAANSEYKYEITPMLGGTFTEGNLNLERNYANGGLSFGFNLDDSMFDQVELGFLRSLEDVDYKQKAFNLGTNTSVTRVFGNLVKEYGLNDSTSLYALVGLGIEHFNNEAYGNETGLFGNYGFGIKYKISEDIALKADLRHLVETDHGDNNLLYTVGIAIPFGKKAAPEAPKVDETPAPKDSDNDGVFDMNDQCPNSAVGALVDKVGCEVDTDQDGVVDSKDKCPDTPKGDIVDENGCSLKVNLNILFDFDSSRINNSYDSRIKKFADFMKAFPSVSGKIEAHTDAKGSDEYNQKLSERRAASVVKALEAYGVDASRLKSIGYGETRPVATNETEEGRALNRRVEGSIQR